MHVIVFPHIWIYLILLSFWFDLISLLRHLLPFAPLSPSNLAFAFNIDEEYPIVITNKFNGKEAHFGATVVLLSSIIDRAPGHGDANHETESDRDDLPTTTGWVLIGAPKANSTTSANHSKIFEPGVIWRCSFGSHNHNNPSNVTTKVCEIVEMDPTVEYDPFDPKLPFRDKKDGGWLGGSMFVGDSDRFVSCASRWINQKYKDLYLLNGICYWLPKSNVIEESKDPNWPRLSSKMSYRLSPLLNRTKQTYRDPTPNLDNGTLSDWAYGQFGFSIHLTPDNELISGSPGTLDWLGGLVYYRDTLAPQPNLRRYNAHAGSAVFSEVLTVPSQTLNHLFHTSDYLGYSVTSGHFFSSSVSKNKTQFAAGAPRSSQLSGKVIIFTLKEIMGSRSEGKVELLVDPLEGRDTTKGNHYGSYFGHSLLALDVNGDGFDDLLVSAPLYGTSLRYKRSAFPSAAAVGQDEENSGEDSSAERHASPIKMKSGDEGCVFVYLSTGEEFSLTPQELCGDKISGSRFGMALSSMSDINYDGFNDLAVGAPYENQGRGAVYIYHGGKEYMVLAQKLQPELIDPNIRTFGWALSLGVDIDHNGYPDLAVGAYETNQVVVYRTIPIVYFTTHLTASVPKLLSSTDDFNITTCITYSGHGTMPNVLIIWVKLTVEVEAEGKRLVALVDPIDSGAKLLNTSPLQNTTRNRRDSEHQLLLLSYKHRLHFRSDGIGNCYNFSAVRVGSVDELSRSVTIRQDYWLDGYDKDTGPVKPLHYEIYPHSVPSRPCCPSPAVNLSQSKSHFKDFFKTKLPLPAGNMFGTEKLVLPVGTICEADGDPECLANLTITAWLQDQHTGEIYTSSSPFILGIADIISIQVELKNHRETVTLPITLTLKWVPPPVVRRLPANCEYFSSNHSLVCSIRRAIKENQMELMSIELDMSGVYGGPVDDKSNVLNISIDATTSSSLVQPASYNLTVPLHTQMKPQDFSHKSSKIDYSVGNVSIPTFGFTQAFEVGLDGPSSAARLRLDFSIPVGVMLSGSNGMEYYQLIGVKRPVITFDGSMRCGAVNGSYWNEDDLLINQFEGIRSSPGTYSENGTMDNFGENDNNENGFPMVSEAANILQSKLKRARRSLWIGQEGTHPYGGGTLKIHCDPSSKSIFETTCLRVTCTASHFTPSTKAVVEFKLRLINKVVAKLLNPENYQSIAEAQDIDSIASLWIESLGVVRTLSKDNKPFGEKGTLQFTSRLEIPPPYDLPAWIIIVSVGGGLLQFTLVTIILKKCGFFRRSKRDELIRRKVEEFERSRIGGTNANSPSTSSTARIRTSSSSSSQGLLRNESFEKFTGGQGSILGMSVGSPGTAVKQREIPGAVDLNELRRLYSYEDQTELY